MVELEVAPALVGGFVATVAMTGMMSMSKAAGMTDMPPMPLVVGSMMSGDRRTAMAAGSMAHYIVMGTLLFGLVYAGLFAGFDNDSWWVGGVIGAVHGILVGAVFMPMMPSMHPRMAQRPVAVGGGSEGGTVEEEEGEVIVTAPGLFGRNWGGMTPAGLVMGHAVYGIVLALVYAAIA